MCCKNLGFVDTVWNSMMGEAKTLCRAKLVQIRSKLNVLVALGPRPWDLSKKTMCAGSGDECRKIRALGLQRMRHSTRSKQQQKG